MSAQVPDFNMMRLYVDRARVACEAGDVRRSHACLYLVSMMVQAALVGHDVMVRADQELETVP